MLRIGEFARLTRVSVRMLRHYDRIGLLAPARVDPATGYRYYRADQLRAVNRILFLRELGFGLDEISEALGGDDDTPYKRREEELVAQLEVATAQLAAVRARRALGEAGADTDVVVRAVPAARVATLRARRGADLGPLFYALEAYVAEHRARADRPPLTILDAGSVTVAVPVRRPVPETALPTGGMVSVQILPAVPTMACAVHNGSYGGLAGHLAHMLEWLERTGRQPDGPLRKVYLRFGAEPELLLPRTHVVDDIDPTYVTELQLPVRPGEPLPEGDHGSTGPSHDHRGMRSPSGTSSGEDG
jgi:DNA-binding transcriptional MerR regulator